MKQIRKHLPYAELSRTGKEFFIPTEELRVHFHGFFYRFEQLSDYLVLIQQKRKRNYV